ncbi:MAG TPA: PIN domain-containing protein [Sandaracinaceae bacterium LLY-WYZ-13_1]|nr:PIN domain-containing protein [Sandaracinaceae bacterium LLY-WYZ-13_1]
MIHLDTHVVVWLQAGRLDQFPPAALRRLEADTLGVSPMVSLELQYLYEIGRVTRPAREVVQSLADRIDLIVAREPFEGVVRAALEQTWTRDPFDRMIVAGAELAQVDLLTRDETIHEHFDRAIWSDE